MALMVGVMVMVVEMMLKTIMVGVVVMVIT